MSLLTTLRRRSVASHPTALRTVATATASLFNPALASTLQTGHGWTASNAAVELNDTADYAPFAGNTQSIRVTSSATGTSAYATSPRLTTPVDLRTSMLRIWYKIDAATIANLSDIILYVGSGASALAAAESVYLMNTNVANSEYMQAKVGQWDYITVGRPSFYQSPTGTLDWSAVQDIRFRVASKVSGEQATVWLGRVDVIPNDTTYGAHGVISFEFDDGYASCVDIAGPALSAQGWAGTTYVIRELIGSGQYLTAANLRTLRDTYGWDVCCHSDTTTNHNLANGFPSLTAAEQRTEMAAIKRWIKANAVSQARHVWAYPRGLLDTSLLAVADDYFSASRIAKYRSIETLPIADPYRCRCLPIGHGMTPNLTPNTTRGTIEWFVDQVYACGGWLRIQLHQIVESPSTTTQYSTANFQTLVDYVVASSIPVRTVGQVLGLR